MRASSGKLALWFMPLSTPVAPFIDCIMDSLERTVWMRSDTVCSCVRIWWKRVM